MLLNNFFYIDDVTHSDSRIEAIVRINASHEILKGHFPEQPVVPGVCMLEMMKEVLQQVLRKKLMMSESVMIKFLTIFSPEKNANALFEIDYKINEMKQLNVSATLKHEATVFFKFKGIFTEK